MAFHFVPIASMKPLSDLFVILIYNGACEFILCHRSIAQTSLQQYIIKVQSKRRITKAEGGI